LYKSDEKSTLSNGLILLLFLAAKDIEQETKKIEKTKRVKVFFMSLN